MDKKEFSKLLDISNKLFKDLTPLTKKEVDDINEYFKKDTNTLYVTRIDIQEEKKKKRNKRKHKKKKKSWNKK